jgi:multiple sugar transport system substrate-binding protein
MSRRLKISGTAVAAAVIAALTSCHKEPVTINVIGEAASAMDGLDAIKDQFTTEFGYRVVLHKYEFQTVQDKTILDFTGRRGFYDGVMGIYYNLGKYSDNHFIVPFEVFFDNPKLRDPKVSLDQFFKPILDVSCYYKGHLMGLPFSGQSMFLWYRKDLFENPDEQKAFQQRYRYSLPTPSAEHAITWAQYRDLAEFFTRRKGTTLAGRPLVQDFYGTVLQGKRHPAAWYEFSNFIFSFGGQISNNGRAEIYSPANLEALDYYRGLKKFCQPGVAQFTWDDALAAMQQGRVALELMWADSAPYLDDPSSSTVVGKVGFGLVPIKEGVNKIVSQYGGWGFYVNAFSHHQEETARFIQWCNRPEIQARWAARGGIPTTTAIYDDPSYKNKPYAAAHRASLAHLTGWPREPYSSQLIDMGAESVSEALSSEISSSELLQRLQSNFNTVLTKEHHQQ